MTKLVSSPIVTHISSPTLETFWVGRGIVIPSRSQRPCEDLLSDHTFNVRWGMDGCEHHIPKPYILNQAWLDVPVKIRYHFYGYNILTWQETLALADLWRQSTFRSKCATP